MSAGYRPIAMKSGIHLFSERLLLRPRLLQSVVTRLVVCLVLGGILLSAGLAFLELRRSETMLRLQLMQRVSLITRNLQTLVRGMLDSPMSEPMRDSLRVVAADDYVLAVRVMRGTDTLVGIGDWLRSDLGEAAVRLLPEYGMNFDGDVESSRLTLVRAPFLHGGANATLELLIDGPRAWDNSRSVVLAGLRMQWLFLGVTTLLGLLLLRRWFTGPLSDVNDLVISGAGPEPFYDLSRHLPGEFGQFAQAVGGMLTRLDCTAQRLKQREKAFENLYQFAPAAMLSVQRDGRIVEANRRAATLLGLNVEEEMIDRPAFDFVDPQDHALLRQTLERLHLDNAARTELRVVSRRRPVDVQVECAAVRDEDGTLQRIRLSMLDISQPKRLQRQLAEKSQLLNLVIDHMSDAIMLVDSDRRIVAHNQQLATLLHRRSDAISGQPYDPEHFWNELGVVDQDAFLDGMRKIEADERPANQRVVTRVGTFHFQGIPVNDAGGQAVGRLWVVEEVTVQEQNERLIRQQGHQISSLKRLAMELQDVRSVDELLYRSADILHEMLGVEAVGLALRCDRKSRSQQIIHRGSGSCLLTLNRQLVQAVECSLMPRVLASSDLNYWSDLPRTEGWAPAFEQAGLTCVAAGPLRGSADALGVLWIARRGGERIERNHLYQLEALMPVIAARVEFAQLREQLRKLELTDPVTDLPNRQQFELSLRNVVNRPGYPWSVILVSLDRFGELNDRLGHEGADALLRRIGNLMRAGVRKGCEVSRLSGKFFAVLTPGIDGDLLLAMAERIRQMVASQPVELSDGMPWQLTASIGVASHPVDGLDPEAIVRLAETRVESAKRAGRNCVVAFNPGVQRQAG